MKLDTILYLFPFFEDKLIQFLAALAALLCSLLAYLVWDNWENLGDSLQFWSQNPEIGLTIDGLVILFILIMATFSWRYFKYYFDELEAKKSQLMGFWAISILIGGSYLYSIVEYRFDLAAQPGWVWTMAINGVVFICWILGNLKYRT